MIDLPAALSLLKCHMHQWAMLAMHVAPACMLLSHVHSSRFYCSMSGEALSMSQATHTARAHTVQYTYPLELWLLPRLPLSPSIASTQLTGQAGLGSHCPFRSWSVSGQMSSCTVRPAPNPYRHDLPVMTCSSTRWADVAPSAAHLSGPGYACRTGRKTRCRY